jgi:predicted tellurium resistance membrane protein TerC
VVVRRGEAGPGEQPADPLAARPHEITDELHGERFFVMKEEGGKWVRYATPLFLVLVLVEVSDLIFAVDSIPAIFAITTDPFIVLTSNVFAILGLRAMYFLLADMADRFSLLKYGLAAGADVHRRQDAADRPGPGLFLRRLPTWRRKA